MPKNNQQARRICIISLSHRMPKLAHWGGTEEHDYSHELPSHSASCCNKGVSHFMFAAMQIINIAILMAS